MEAIRFVKELTKMGGTEQQKLINEMSGQAKDNPLLPNLLNMAKRAGVCVLEDGVYVCVGGVSLNEPHLSAVITM